MTITQCPWKTCHKLGTMLCLLGFSTFLNNMTQIIATELPNKWCKVTLNSRNPDFCLLGSCQFCTTQLPLTVFYCLIADLIACFLRWWYVSRQKTSRPPPSLPQQQNNGPTKFCCLFFLASLDMARRRALVLLNCCIIIAVFQKCLITKLLYFKNTLLQNCSISKMTYYKIAVFQNCLIPKLPYQDNKV